MRTTPWELHALTLSLLCGASCPSPRLPRPWTAQPYCGTEDPSLANIVLVYVSPNCETPSKARDMLCSGRGSEVCLAQLTFVCWLGTQVGSGESELDIVLQGPSCPPRSKEGLYSFPKLAARTFS